MAKQPWKDAYGYPWWMPAVAIAVYLFAVGSVVAALVTRDWRLLIGTALAWWAMAAGR